MKYIIKKTDNSAKAYPFEGEFDPNYIKEPWRSLNEAGIADYPWINDYPNSFPAFARVGSNEDGFTILMYAKESPILAEETKFGGMPCMDSCLEFFLMPFPGADKAYINVEINPKGAAHIGFGEGRHNRFVHKSEIEGLQITHGEEGEYWAIGCFIPHSLFMRHFGMIPCGGAQMRGNFYKCAEKLHEHYGVWNHVGTLKPDFHTPEYFGDIVIE